MNRKSACLSLLLSAFSLMVPCAAQTTISGLIDQHTTLYRTGSPYLVTDHLVVVQGISLTIEPGVELQFASGKHLEVRGVLIAQGTEGDSISFTTQGIEGKGIWNGIVILNDQAANATFDYCRFLYATTAINETCCGSGLTTVNHSRFFSNTVAIGGYSGHASEVKNSRFSHNTYALTQADKNVDACVFSYNDYGLYQTERINVLNSTFTGHTEAALYGGRGTVDGCDVTGNNVGIRAFFEGFTVKNSEVSGNTKGILTGDYDQYIPPIQGNRICNNAVYNLEHTSDVNYSVAGNCFCTSDSTAIEDLISDGLDNSSAGLVSYSIYSADCITLMREVDKTLINLSPEILTKSNSPYSFNNDLIVYEGKTLTIEPGVELRFAEGKKLEVRGTLNALGSPGDSITFTTSASHSRNSWSGIVIRNEQLANANFDYCKFLFASTAIQETCCGTGKTTVNHSRFSENSTGMGGYSGTAAQVKNSRFTDNNYAITQADKNIDASVFDGNSYGLFSTERVTVSNSTFSNHLQAALYGGRGSVSNCTITGNEIGIQSFFEGFNVSGSTISENTKGIITGAYGNYIPPVSGNNICNNELYNIEHTSDLDFSVAGNCFCVSDSTAIEDKIYDGLDNSSAGLVSFSIFEDDCSTLIREVDKTLINLSPDVLTRSNSPYTFNEDLIVYAGKTLTIEPGVELRFAQGKKLEVRGTLNAYGSAGDSITFTSLTAAFPYGWTGIVVKNDQQANANFAYCKFTNASVAIQETCCGSGKTTVMHSRFFNNHTGMGGYSGYSSTVKHSVFSGNTFAMLQADKQVDSSFFFHNTYGLYATERISVSNSVFTDHTEVALYGGRGTLDNCTITYNNIAVQSFFEGFTIRESRISYNNKGIISGSYGSYSAPVEDNRICYNLVYNIEHTSNGILDATNNCFCTSDSTTIENKILDGYDDPVLGLVEYSIYNNDCGVLYYNMVARGSSKEMVDEIQLEVTGFSGSAIMSQDSEYVFEREKVVYASRKGLNIDKFYLEISGGDHYEAAGPLVVPETGYTGFLFVPFVFTDGIVRSNQYVHRIEVVPPTGIADEFLHAVTVHPSPTDGKISVRSALTIKEVRLVSHLGKEVRLAKPVYRTNVVNLDISEFPSGLYIVSIHTDGGTFYRRIIRN